jgi:hypothetical protein
LFEAADDNSGAHNGVGFLLQYVPDGRSAYTIERKAPTLPTGAFSVAYGYAVFTSMYGL